MTRAEQRDVIVRAVEARRFDDVPVTDALVEAEALLGEPLRGDALEDVKYWAATQVTGRGAAEIWAAVRAMVVAWNERLR